MKNKNIFYIVYVIISFFLFLFYLNFVNFSTDTIILFISQKIFLGKWLSQGVVPLFNPHIFAGVPYLFDPGMGNLHPFNLLFLLPYPYSFAAWSSVTTLLFLIGFHLFFRSFTKSELFAFILTLVLFFSGSGFWRTNNPAISLVIAHYGLFFYSFKLINKNRTNWLFFSIGLLMTLSGHIQFVFYGYIIAFLTGLLCYKKPFKNIVGQFVLLIVICSWFFILALPLVLESTRLTTHKNYSGMGPLHPFQIIQLILPLFFGYVSNGSKWNAGPTFVILISTLFLPALIFLAVKKKITRVMGAIFLVFLAATYGIVNFPFFRGAAQSFIVIHILGLILIAQNEELLIKSLVQVKRKWIFLLGIGSSLGYFFFTSGVFHMSFSALYRIIKKAPSLFYDDATIKSIGSIIGLNFIPLSILSIVLFVITVKKKWVLMALIGYVLFEGLFINYFHNYFIPQSVLIENLQSQQSVISEKYRIQTGADVLPYFGFHNYMSEVLFRPPFSKEPTSFTPEEQQTFKWLKTIFSYNPSTWGMVHGIYSVQGYNTFVPKTIAEFFKNSSADYRQEYAYIIERNPLYGESEIGLDINGIETSKITLHDERWKELAVRYFISDRPLKGYTLLFREESKFIYENKKTLSIFRLRKKNMLTDIEPVVQNPNEFQFDIKKDDIGSQLVVVINTGGFEASINGKKVEVQKKPNDFRLIIPLVKSGTLKVYYSPLKHLQEVLWPKS